MQTNEVEIKITTNKHENIIPYNIEVLSSLEYDMYIDYNLVKSGDLFFKTDQTLDKVCLDINDNGELCIISEDAQNYSLNEDGELIYNN